MVKFVGACLLAAALWGCATPAPQTGPDPGRVASPPGPAASLPRYRCDHGLEFTVQFRDDAAVLDVGARGSELLLRDAGGVTPQQTVYSNSRLRAEFGLGPAGRAAVLHYLSPPLLVACARE